MPAPRIVTVIGYFAIRPGNAARFRDNCEAMVALRDKEAGHPASAYSFESDSAAVSREDYESADAFAQHLDVGKHIFETTRQLVDITGVEAHGPADEIEKLRPLLSDMSPRFFRTEFGFRR